MVNTGPSDLRLYTVYAPPAHAPGTIHRTKAEADLDEADHPLVDDVSLAHLRRASRIVTPQGPTRRVTVRDHPGCIWVARAVRCGYLDRSRTGSVHVPPRWLDAWTRDAGRARSMRMATVTFEHVYKRFGDFMAVNDLNLEIGDGEFMVLVGPSGCGKTTSLRMIAGLEEISEGTLRIGDRVVNDVAPKDRDIAMVFQSYALYPHMSVRDNLAFGLKLRKVPKAEIERRVKEAADTIQLGSLLDRKPKELSGGQRQRVALGRAIVREPAVFLMDEPLSNLDAKLRVQTRAEIARLHQRLKTTIVYVTHDQVEAMTMGTRIAVMNEGLLQQVGTPQALYDTPVNRFVAGFIGSPSMNFVDVTVEGTGADARLRRRRRLVHPAAAPDPRRDRRRTTSASSWPASGRSTSTSARPVRASVRSGPGRTSWSTSATRSSSTSTPPTRTSSPSSARSIGCGRATSSTWSSRSRSSTCSTARRVRP